MMTDFFTKLVRRTLGLVPTVKPLIAPIYAPGLMIAGDYSWERLSELRSLVLRENSQDPASIRGLFAPESFLTDSQIEPMVLLDDTSAEAGEEADNHLNQVQARTPQQSSRGERMEGLFEQYGEPDRENTSEGNISTNPSFKEGRGQEAVGRSLDGKVWGDTCIQTSSLSSPSKQFSSALESSVPAAIQRSPEPTVNQPQVLGESSTTETEAVSEEASLPLVSPEAVPSTPSSSLSSLVQVERQQLNDVEELATEEFQYPENRQRASSDSSTQTDLAKSSTEQVHVIESSSHSPTENSLPTVSSQTAQVNPSQQTLPLVASEDVGFIERSPESKRTQVEPQVNAVDAVQPTDLIAVSESSIPGSGLNSQQSSLNQSNSAPSAVPVSVEQPSEPGRIERQLQRETPSSRQNQSESQERLSQNPSPDSNLGSEGKNLTTSNSSLPPVTVEKAPVNTDSPSLPLVTSEEVKFVEGGKEPRLVQVEPLVNATDLVTPTQGSASTDSNTSGSRLNSQQLRRTSLTSEIGRKSAPTNLAKPSLPLVSEETIEATASQVNSQISAITPSLQRRVDRPVAAVTDDLKAVSTVVSPQPQSIAAATATSSSVSSQGKTEPGSIPTQKQAAKPLPSHKSERQIVSGFEEKTGMEGQALQNSGDASGVTTTPPVLPLVQSAQKTGAKRSPINQQSTPGVQRFRETATPYGRGRGGEGERGRENYLLERNLGSRPRLGSTSQTSVVPAVIEPRLEPENTRPLTVDFSQSQEQSPRIEPPSKPWSESQQSSRLNRSGSAPRVSGAFGIAASESTPTIEVSIGRVEVRGVKPPEPPPTRKKSVQRSPGSPALSLSDYLKQREGG